MYDVTSNTEQEKTCEKLSEQSERSSKLEESFTTSFDATTSNKQDEELSNISDVSQETN